MYGGVVIFFNVLKVFVHDYLIIKCSPVRTIDFWRVNNRIGYKETIPK